MANGTITVTEAPASTATSAEASSTFPESEGSCTVVIKDGFFRLRGILRIPTNQ